MSDVAFYAMVYLVTSQVVLLALLLRSFKRGATPAESFGSILVASTVGLVMVIAVLIARYV